MAPPIDAREKLGTALRQALTQTPLSKISVSALTRAAGVTRQAFYYHFNSLSDLNAWVFREEITARLTTSSGEWLDAIEATMMWMHEHREEITARLTTSSGEWLDAIEATMMWMHEHRDETASAMKTIEANDLWAFLASHIQELIESRLDGSATATARDVVAQHFALASTAHMAQWMLSGLEVNPSVAIARMRVLMTDQTTPALARLAQ